jgi:hypothetical protein
VSKLLARFRRAELDAKIRRILEESIEEDEPMTPTRHAITKLGDPHRFRGIPAVGRTVDGIRRLAG